MYLVYHPVNVNTRVLKQLSHMPMQLFPETLNNSGIDHNTLERSPVDIIMIYVSQQGITNVSE